MFRIPHLTEKRRQELSDAAWDVIIISWLVLAAFLFFHPYFAQWLLG